MVASNNDDFISADDLNNAQEIDLTHEEVTELAEEIDEPEMLGIQEEDEANIDLPNHEVNNENEVDAPETFANSQEEFEEPSVDDSSSELSVTDSSAPAVYSKDSSHQAFYYHIEKRNFFNAFAAIFDKAVNLDIMTIVEDENDPVFQGKWQHLEGLSGQRIITRISLLDGDIKNIIGSRFIENPAYKDLLTFHIKQVDKGQDIIDKNLDCLKKALDYLKELKNQDTE